MEQLQTDRPKAQRKWSGDEVLAANMKRRRLELGLTQQDIATEICKLSGKHITMTAVSHWERGFRSPSIHNLIWLAKALGCSAEDVVMGTAG